jgi:HD-like signal output (HDOD) protein
MGAEEHLKHLPAHRAAALHVMEIAGHSWASSKDVAAALQIDPAMTANVLRLANSAHHGMSGRVRSLEFAVTVVGFSAVRSMAATFAAVVAGAPTPQGFWERATASAAATAVTAPQVGAVRVEGFSVGLLHELGDYLLFRRDPEAHAGLVLEAANWDCRRRCRHERARFGTDHGALLAESLESWHFPEDFVAAYASHCETNRAGSPLARALVGAQALTALAQLPDDERMWAADLVGRLTSRLAIGGIDPADAWALSRRAREEADVLAACLPIPA